MNDGFSTEERRAAWWATDSRRAVSGQLFDVIQEKRGEKERADLSEVEEVQMGLRMQPVIGRMFEEATGIKVRDLDIAGTLESQPWLRAHGDFETGDGGLLEVKNYHAATINRYSEPDEPMRLPLADLIQCVHEATVFDKPHVYFAVLFGGQRFRWWKIDVTDEMREDLIKRAAIWWAHIEAGTYPEAETPDQARVVWKQDNEGSITATAQLETMCAQLRNLKDQLKEYEAMEAKLIVQIQNYMGASAILESIDGRVLATWKSAKASSRFSPDLLKKSMPDLYDKFVVPVAGSRRFLVK